jgi:hypothetical protein
MGLPGGKEGFDFLLKVPLAGDGLRGDYNFFTLQNASSIAPFGRVLMRVPRAGRRLSGTGGDRRQQMFFKDRMFQFLDYIMKPGKAQGEIPVRAAAFCAFCRMEAGGFGESVKLHKGY